MKFIEEIIQKAQKSGEFKNLKNEGERLKLDENPYTAETRLAHSIIKQAGYRPSFIDNQKRLKDMIAETCDLLQKASDSWTGTKWSKIRWNEAVTEFQKRVVTLNRQIRDYNLKAPNEQFFVIPIDPDREIKRFSPENIGGAESAP
ncbi:MAG: DUF1992 domain-containing protein [Anaerolineae bacterium]